MKLVLITPEDAATDETEIVNKLFISGLQRLHIRKPVFTIGDYRNYIKAIDGEYHSHIVIHGFYELYKEFGLNGIHLNTTARNDENTWAQIRDLNITQAAISTSFHSWQEIEQNEFPYRYVFISPVFDSISKAGYKAGIDLNGAIETKQKLKAMNKYYPEIIGLGGVGQEQLGILSGHSFDGAAMLGAIWNNEFPVVMFSEAILQLRSL